MNDKTNQLAQASEGMTKAYENGFKAGAENAARTAAVASNAMESMHRAAIDQFGATVAQLTANAQRQIMEATAQLAEARKFGEDMGKRVDTLTGDLEATSQVADEAEEAHTLASDRVSELEASIPRAAAVRNMLEFLLAKTGTGVGGPTQDEIEKWHGHIFGPKSPDAAGSTE